jgi:hypothetical protein
VAARPFFAAGENRPRGYARLPRQRASRCGWSPATRPKPAKKRPPPSDPIAAPSSARPPACLAQIQLAERLKTVQGSLARLERGRFRPWASPLIAPPACRGTSLPASQYRRDRDKGDPRQFLFAGRQAQRSAAMAQLPFGGTPSSLCAESAAMSGSPDRSTGARPGHDRIWGHSSMIASPRLPINWIVFGAIVLLCSLDMERPSWTGSNITRCLTNR